MTTYGHPDRVHVNNEGKWTWYYDEVLTDGKLGTLSARFYLRDGLVYQAVLRLRYK